MSSRQLWNLCRTSLPGPDAGDSKGVWGHYPWKILKLRVFSEMAFPGVLNAYFSLNKCAQYRLPLRSRDHVDSSDYIQSWELFH